MSELTAAHVLADLFDSDDFDESFENKPGQPPGALLMAEVALQRLTDAGFEVRSTWPPSVSPHERCAEDETAWLIEMAGKNGVPNYFQLAFDEDWTPDANKALRFARRKDADAYINHIGWTSPYAVEHMWPALPRADGGGK
jgi:hypothetical protein